MTSASNKTGRATLVPNAAPCVWMSAGLVAYKLCDRQLDCEHCAFDAALRGTALHESVEGAPTPRGDWSFPDDRHYSLHHLWIQRVDASHVRLGLDALASNLIGASEVVELPAVGTWLRADAHAATFQNHGARTSVRTPLGGHVAAINESVRASPDLTARAPYDAGWLVELTLADSGHPTAEPLMSAQEIEKRTRLDV